MSVSNIIKVLVIVAIAIPATYRSAFAGYRDGAIAAGIIGAALGTAIIMQGQRVGSPHYRSHRRTVRAKKPMSAGTAAASKDPFAGASAPADYAKPVSTPAR